VLLDKFEDAAQVMLNIGDNPKVLDKVYYKDWPIFKMFILSDHFRKAYLEIYKVEFEIVEKKDACRQRAVSRKRGSNPADNFVRNSTLLPRSKCSGSPACVKPLGRCKQCSVSVVREGSLEKRV